MNENYVEVEVFLLVDEVGDYVAHHSLDELGDLYDNCIGDSGALPRRIVKLVIQVEKPQVVKLAGEAPLVGNGAKLVAVKGGA